jgi:predicted MPP superfamily phosphohydrolase
MTFVAHVLISSLCLAVVHQWAAGAFPSVGRRRRGLAIALAALFSGELATSWLEMHTHLRGAAAVHTAATVVLMALDIAAMPLLAMRVVAWLLRRLERPVSPVPIEPAGLTRRQLVEAVGGVGALGASGAVLGWGAVRGRHMFETCEVPVRIAGLPRALDGYVIAQISDLHVGHHIAERDIDAGLDLVRRARPDLVVVTGDLVDNDWALAPFIARKLADLPSRDGVAAILGNHDYYANAAQVVAALRAAGIHTLVDDGRLIRAGDGGGFALLGVDDRWATRYGRSGPDLDRALAAVPRDVPRILLSHQPPTVRAWAGRVALQLSGHTHGGQINPGFRPADLFFPYVAGAYTVGGTTLYVNRGFGTVGPPSRVGAPPEVTRIVLVAA